MRGDGRVRFAEQLAMLRAQAGLSLAEVATASHVARGYVHHLEHGRRWPSRSVAELLDSALSADGTLLAIWSAADHDMRSGRAPVVGAMAASHQLQKVEMVLMSAADESARFLAWAETSNIGDLTVEQMHSDIQWIARNYLKVPTLPLFTRARTIRDQAFALLGGRQRPDQTRFRE